MCKSGNSFDLKLDLFYDKYCTSYAGNEYDLSDFTSGKLTDQSLTREHYDEGCLSCKMSDMPYYVSSNSNNDDGGNDYYGGQYYYTNDVQEVCESVYYYAAKCEPNLSAAQSSSYSYNSQYTAEEQKAMTCSYIDSVARGTYNEEGKIYLNQKSYNKQKSYHRTPDPVVTGAQSFWLSFFIIGCVGLAAVGTHLHRSLRNTDKTAQLIYSSGQIS